MSWDAVITGVLVMAAAAGMARLGWRTIRTWRGGGTCNNCASGTCTAAPAPPQQKIIQISLDEALRSRSSVQSDEATHAGHAMIGQDR